MKKKKSGVGTNFVIHKYFYERDPSWQQIRDEEAQAQVLEDAQEDDQPEALEDLDANEGPSQVVMNFDPIDARHLSSLPLVRARIVKLLKASENNLHASNNMLIAIVGYQSIFFATYFLTVK